MKTKLLICCVLAAVNCLPAATRYVSLDGNNSPPYTDWVGAATTIQAAISVSSAGDWIWVSNGTYETGTAGGSRVSITTAVTVASWNNDRSNTIIKGDAGIRPVYMGENANLFGFTLTNGNMAGNNAGGAHCIGTNSVISNCLIIANMASGSGGGAYSTGYLIDCDIIGNQAAHGGGIAGLTPSGAKIYRCNVVANHATSYAGGVRASCIYDSQIISNTAVSGGGGGYAVGSPLYYMSNCVLKFNSTDLYGGGAYQFNLFHCELISNSAISAGGGAWGMCLCNCLLVGNIASNGGGAYRSHIYHSEIRGNYATNTGGGVYLTASESMTNCLVIGNEAGSQAGGVWGNTGARVDNCTIAGNSANSYGGVRHITAYNTIIWSNRCIMGNENQFTADYYSCAPECTNADSISDNPCLVDFGSGYGTNHVAGNYRLEPTSLCVNTGTNMTWMADGDDLDGHTRLDRFARKADMGCYEYIPQGIIFNFR